MAIRTLTFELYSKPTEKNIYFFIYMGSNIYKLCNKDLVI